MGRAIKISVGFVTGALILLAGSLYLSNYYLQQQSRAAEAGDLKEARDKVEMASSLDPFGSAPLASQAYLELRQGREEEAAEAFEEAIRRDPANFENYMALGDIQRQQLGDSEAAAESYRQALERNPYATAVVSRLGEALFNAGDLEGAEEQYEWLREQGKIPLKDLYSLGKIQVRLNKSEEAIETFEEAREKAEGELDSLDERQRTERENFIEALDIDVAEALVVQGSYEEAREMLSQSEADQAAAVLELLEEDPESYRRSVLDDSVA